MLFSIEIVINVLEKQFVASKAKPTFISYFYHLFWIDNFSPFFGLLCYVKVDNEKARLKTRVKIIPSKYK